MNRDNLLFAVIGLVIGFILAYLAFEAMAFRQPTPLFGQTPAPAGVPAAQGAMNAPGGAGATSGTGAAEVDATGAGEGPMAAMEQVQRLAAYVRENPDDLDAVRTLANLNYDVRNWSRAAELYASFLEKKPGDTDVMTDLGACYRQLGKHQEALALFRQVAEENPQHWQARFNEVLVLAFDLDQEEPARAALDELVALQPENPDVRRLAEQVRERFGDA